MGLTDAGEDAIEGLRGDGAAHGSRGHGSTNGEQIGDVSGDVGGSHGGSADGVGFSVVPGGGDIETGGEYIDNGSVVGERGNRISDGASSDGNSRGGTSGAGSACIGGRVSGGDSDVDPTCGQLERKGQNWKIMWIVGK